MKTNIYMFAAALAIAWTGCTDDEIIEKGIPVETGDEILFASFISKNNNQDADNANTRTVYGERTETGVPVYWDPDNGDDIAIFCPQASAPADKLVKYIVKPDKNSPQEQWNTSSTVEKDALENVGLQWGVDNEHKFYALYPSSRLKDATSDEVANHGKLTASIPTNQKVSKWYYRVDPTSPNRSSVYYGLPDMNNAYMWAHQHVYKDQLDKNSAINLKFQNLVTVMDITIPGPEDPEESITITNINMTSQDPNDEMTGDFYFYIKEGESQPQGTCEPAPSKAGEVRNNISIPCYDEEKKQYITLKGPNESLNVKAYIVPDNRKDHITDRYRILKFTVAMLNGASLTKTLTYEQLANLRPQKVNRIVLPRVKNADPAYWMSNLDPNIYLTELSIPGSKMSYSTSKDNAGIPAFQTKGISEQFDAGVRAFIIQVKANRQGKLTIPKAANKDLSETLKEISLKLETAKNAGKTNEFAVVVLTAETVDFEGWIKTVNECLKAYSSTSGISLYTDPITPNTTMADVGNKIIIKVNYNYAYQENYIPSGSRAPAMFAIWKNPNESPDFCPKSDLYWGDMQETAQMEWMAAEVTHVGTNDNTEAEISQANKISSIRNMLQNSVDAYKNSTAHNIWFMTDAGGVYKTTEKATSVFSKTTYSTTDLAKEMNQLVVDQLQTRGQNASTGIVFINFADRDPNSGVLYKSDYILSSVIDNNFKFNLRKKGSTSAR